MHTLNEEFKLTINFKEVCDTGQSPGINIQ